MKEAASRYAKEEYSHKNPANLPDRCIGCYAPLIYAFKDGAQWQKQRIIDKVCEWLNKNFVDYHPRTGELKPVVNINAFREAMEDEQ